MNETTRQGTEFFFRRLADPPELFGVPLYFHPMWWLAIAVPILLVALVLVYRMYFRDSQAVGGAWGSFLAILRTLTYLSLFIIWLLPAIREVEWTEQRSRVLLLFDVSGSVHTSDDPIADDPDQVRRTRQDLVLGFLRAASPSPPTPPTPPSEGGVGGVGSEGDFLARLLAKNPLFCYRFGEQLDEKEWTLTRREAGEKVFDPLEWSRRLRPTARPTIAEPVFSEILEEYRRAGERLRETQNLEGTAREQRQKELFDELQRAVGDQQQLRERLLARTNVGDALLRLLRKESGNMVQGIVLFSDGRNNTGNSQDVIEALNLAKKEKIPILAVGVGEHREVPNLRLADVLAPAQVQPEDEFPVRVVVEGENLPRGQEVEIVLTVEKPAPNTNLPPEKQNLPPQKVTLTGTTARLATGAAEFRITNPEKRRGEWKFRARVGAIKGERARADNVNEEPAIVKVVDRRLRVLLFAGGPLRDYQFLRTLLVREREKFELTIFLQTVQPGVVQDVDPKRLLEKFPNDLRDENADPLNLGNYDVIVAFDPDWRALSPEAAENPRVRDNLRKWVQDFGGGLIVVAGPIHTFTLAREKDLQAIRELYPVVLDDTASSFTIIDRPSKDAWALNWSPTASQMTFLDLTETGDKTKALAGWEEFFGVQRKAGTGVADQPAQRGFYSFFPIREIKPGATVLARYSDPNYVTPKQERQPYFVTHTARKGQVFYVGSGETWRLRQFNEKFHERFWTKLIRHMARSGLGGGSRRGLVIVGSRYAEGDTVEVEAQLYDAEMRPLQPDAKKKILLKVSPPEGAGDVPREWTDGVEMKPSPGRAGWFSTRFPVRRVGKYNLQVTIPDSLETLAGNFRVESTDPELDQTRPDFALLHRLASDAREIRLLDEKKRPDFLEALAQSRDRIKSPSNGGVPASPSVTPETEGDRLFFDLNTASWIPECLDSNVVPYRTEGKVIDLWDKGWTVLGDIHHPLDATGPPWALVLVVSLLSVEWLTRKLLRLA